MLALLLLVAQVPADAPPRFVLASVANLRDTPDSSGKLRLKLPIQTPVTLIETKEQWARIVAGRCQGWVLSEVLAEEEVTLNELRKKGLEAKTPADKKTWLERAAAVSPWDVETLTALVAVLEELKDKSLQQTKDGLEVAKIAAEHQNGRNVQPGAGRPGIVLTDKVNGINEAGAVVRKYNTGDVVTVKGRKTINGKPMLQIALLQGEAFVDPKSIHEAEALQSYLNSTQPIEETNLTTPAGSDLGTLKFHQRAAKNPSPAARTDAASRLLWYKDEAKKAIDQWAALARDFDRNVRIEMHYQMYARLTSSEKAAETKTPYMTQKTRELVDKMPAGMTIGEAEALGRIVSAVVTDEDGRKLRQKLNERGLRCQ